MAEIEQINGADNGNQPDTLRQAYPKVNRNFTRVNNQLVGHIDSNAAHAAENITYNGAAPGENVKQAIDGLDTRIDGIVAQAGNDNTEIVDARGGYPVLGDRLNDFDEQLAETEKLALNSNGMSAMSIQKMLSGLDTKYVCYGDSLVWGFKPVDPGRGTQVANPFPAVLQSRLRTIYNNNNITVVNKGMNGARTVEGLQNIAQVTAENPDVVIIMFGVNDVRGSSYGGVVSPNDYRSNLSQMVEILLTDNAEVILLSPTPINDMTNNNHKMLRAYSRIVGEVAQKYGVGFIDVQNEITRMYFSQKIYPVDFFGDSIHFLDDNYKYIADVVAGRLLQYNESTRVLFLDSREQYSVPIFYSPFVDHNLTDSYTHASQIYKSNYTMPVGSSGLYLRINFFVSVPNMSLILRHIRNTLGGQITVYDNGASVGVIDFYAPASHVFNTETVIIKNLPLGWHSIAFEQSNLIAGQSSSGNAYFSEFMFRPFDDIIDDRPYINITGATTPLLENFKKVTEGKTRLKNITASEQKGAILFSGGSVQLEDGKKLIVEAEGKFFSTSGITWFGNTMQNAGNTVVSGVLSGYLIYLSGTQVQLYRFGGSNAIGSAIGTGDITGFDYNVSHLIRIEHSYSGNIVVYIDGVEKINITDTGNKNGFFGLWAYGAGTISLDRYEYCLV